MQDEAPIAFLIAVIDDPVPRYRKVAGTRGTGNGHREAGQAALDVFTEWKSVYVDYSGKLQRAQIDNAERPAPQ